MGGECGEGRARPGLFVDMATSLERAGFDYMMLEDSSVLPDVFEGSLRHSLKTGVVRHDPMPPIPLLGAATSRLGTTGTASTSFYPPFLAARLFRTLDHLTEGRVGLNLVTSSPHAAAQNYGHDKHFEHDLRYKMADEWMTLVGQLWDSWDPDAVILDEDSGYFADPPKSGTSTSPASSSSPAARSTPSRAPSSGPSSARPAAPRPAASSPPGTPTPSSPQSRASRR